MNPEAFAYANPLVKQFMSEYPNAQISATHYSAEESQQILEQISIDCGKEISQKEFYKINIDDPDSGLKVVAWVDMENLVIECAVKYGIGDEKTISKPGEPVKTCESHAEFKCYGENVYWFDSCGHKQEKKEYCQEGCELGFCKEKKEKCESHAEYKCYEGHVYWFDSCGNVEEKKEYCSQGCEGGVCTKLILVTRKEGGGLGISPAKFEIYSEPGKKIEFLGTVKNEMDASTVVNLFDDGDLEEFGELITEEVYLSPLESAEFTYTLDLPEDLEHGQHETTLWAADPVEAHEDETAPRLKVGMKIIVYVPYPEEEECVDSDGGKDYYEKGTVTKGTQSLSDHCNEDGTLTEKYCENNEIKAETVECPDGYECSEGKCAGVDYDLAVLGVSMEPETPFVDENIFFEFKVKNLGNANIDYFDWILNISGGNNAMALKHPMGDSQETVVKRITSFYESGMYNFTFRLDPFDKIDEINEDNNVIEGTIKVLSTECIDSPCTIYAGENRYILFEDNEYEIAVLGASSESTGIISINEDVDKVDEGLFYTIGGLKVDIEDVDYKNPSSVLLAIGGNPLLSILQYHAVLSGGVYLSTNERGIFVGDNVNSARDQLTEEDLPEILESGVFHDSDSNEFPYDQYIILGSSKIYDNYIDIGTDASSPVYTTKIVFTDHLDFSSSMVNTLAYMPEYLSLFNKSYIILPESTNDEIQLLESIEYLFLNLNEPETFIVNQIEHKIEMVGYTETETILRIDEAEENVSWEEGNTYIIPGGPGVRVHVASVSTMYMGEGTEPIHYVSLHAGNTMILKDNQKVKVNYDYISGTLVDVEKTSGKVSSVSVSVAGQYNDKLTFYDPYKTYTDPVWKSFKLAYAHPTNLRSSITIQKV